MNSNTAIDMFESIMSGGFTTPQPKRKMVKISSHTSIIKIFIDDICAVEGYTVEQCVVKYLPRLSRTHTNLDVFTFLYESNLSRFISVGKSELKMDAITALIENCKVDSHDTQVTFYNMVSPQHKVFLQCYMLEKDIIPLKLFNRNMVELCGTPILCSELINNKYVRGDYLWNHVYKIFYNSIKGKSNYKKWVGFADTRKGNVRRPSGTYNTNGFRVKLDSVKDITYLRDAMLSGINYNTRFHKNLRSKEEMVDIIDMISDTGISVRKIDDNILSKLYNAVDGFTSDELLDLDGYVLKLRAISKSKANNIAKNYPDACQVYIGYRGL